MKPSHHSTGPLEQRAANPRGYNRRPDRVSNSLSPINRQRAPRANARFSPSAVAGRAPRASRRQGRRRIPCRAT
jgi:hypothetical protein